METKRIRVLIVEDHEPTAYLIKKAFRAQSANVEWDLCFSKNGEEALDFLFHRGINAEAALPDFVLLDWNLPKMSGEEVLRLIKSTETLQTLPVLVFSSSQQESEIHAAYKGHANGYIIKPFDLDDLYVAIESIKNFWVHTARLPPKPGSGGPPQ